MRQPAWSIATAMLFCACTVPGVHDGLGGDDDIDTGTTSGVPASDGSNATPGMCAVTGAPGTIVQQVQLAPDAGLAVLVADPTGGLAYAGPDGIVRLAPDLTVRFRYPYGSTVALDAHGNAFVAGSFSEPTDFGTGTLTPTGNINTFLVELSPTGEVLFAKALDQCGDGVEAIAVARDGRIAISGAAMGTVVTDAYGTIELTEDVSGKLAFTSDGTLVVGGSSGDDALVSAFDATGHPVYAVRLGDAGGEGPDVQTIVGVAAGPQGRVAIVGAFRAQMDLFGTTVRALTSFPSGRIAGTFVAVLDTAGEPVFAVQGTDVNSNVRFGGVLVTGPTGVDRQPGTPIVVDGSGDVVVSSDQPGNAQPPFAYPQLTRYAAATGAVTLSLGNVTGPIGAGLGVALDACGDAVWAAFENVPSILDPHTLLSRVAL